MSSSPRQSNSRQDGPKQAVPTRIGPFEVLGDLGRGGMGVVYLARDTRLDRQVAIKALPADLTATADRLARFEREAKVLASLNHPNIANIYGLEDVDGQRYLVLEYVAGETLAAQILRDAIPVDEALPLASQIAGAVEAAHEKGIIHRDLKPGNVMVTPDGTVKVLDFGLARSADGAPSSAPAAPDVDSPTVRAVNSPTIPGAIMGTAGYMSPEQARGKAVDKRSDIFSFGCVLYEMLTGSPPFHGETVTDSLGAILHRDPDWSRLPANTPPRVRELLASSLVKDRKNRLRDIGDARLELARAIEGREWNFTAAAPRGAIGRWLPWVIAVVGLILAAMTAWRPWEGPREKIAPSAPAELIRFQVSDVETPPRLFQDTAALAISVDGRRVAYTAREAGRGDFIVIRRMDDMNVVRLAVPIVSDAYPGDPIFSPDGRWIAFFLKSDLYKIPIGGGVAVRLFDGPNNVQTKGGFWTDKGIIFCPAPNAGLVRVSDQGGEPETLTVPDTARDELSHRWPDVLPDGRHVLMTVKKSGILTFDDAEIALLDLETRIWKTIIRGGSFARYETTGHIVFGRNGAILAVPFDLAAAKVTGSPMVVVPDVVTAPGSGAAQFAIARDCGTLIYVSGGVDEPRNELVWVDCQGTIDPVGAPSMNYGNTFPSPDGTRTASTVFGANDAVFVYDFVRRTNTRVTFRGNCSDPVWTRDGLKLAFASDADGPFATYLVNADGSGKPEKILDRALGAYGAFVEVEGKLALVYDEDGDIWLHRLGSQTPQKLIGSQFTESRPHLSRDGRWLSYASNDSGRYEVYIRPFPSREERWQVSIGGGTLNWWSPDGDFIIYGSPNEREFLKVSIRSASGVEAGRPESLVTLPEAIGHPELHSDGKRILAIRDLPRKFSADRVNAVLNWFEELRAKVPAGSPGGDR